MSVYNTEEQAPDLAAAYPLLQGERVISSKALPPRLHPKNPSSLQQLLRLAQADHLDEIGNAGPVLASLAMPKEGHESSEELEQLHLYEAFFIRDSLRVVNELEDSYPELTRATLRAVAEYQGVRDDPSREEEEGRSAHEVRQPNDPRAQELTEERGWQWPYYGSVDATTEFVRTLATYALKGPAQSHFLNEPYIDREGRERTMLDALDRAVGWIARRRAQNAEGLVEFKSVLPKGIENQAWKDSWDAYHHSDGTLANHDQGVASIEVQISAYEGLLAAADVYRKIISNDTRATALQVQATELREAIFSHFWTEDKGGYFVLGTDRDAEGALRQLQIRTSNMGHVLNSQLLEGDDPDIVRKREAVVAQLTSPELWCKAGIRTLASDEVRFREGAYHNGSVWLWDTHYIARGLRRHGYEDIANALDDTLIEISDTTGMFPEYVRGEQDAIKTNRHKITLWDEIALRENIVEQPPQEVHAWTVSAIVDSKRGRWRREARNLR